MQLTGRDQFDPQVQFLPVGGLRDGPPGLFGVAPHELVRAIHHHLRGVWPMLGESHRIGLLAGGNLGRRKRIAPPEVVPIVDVLAERDDRNAWDELAPFQPLQQQVRWRTTRAPLGSK